MYRESDSRPLRLMGTSLLGLLLCYSQAQAQIGDSLAGVGPINRSIGGAAVAAPIDAGGALFWNPATIGALNGSEMEFGVELLIPRTTITSRVAAGAFAPGLPPQPMYGRTGGNNGVAPLPLVGLVYRPDDSPLTYGFGLFSVAGFSVDYPASRANAVLQPQPPHGLGLGPLYSSYQLLQLAPTLSYQLTDQVSVGVAGNLDLGMLSANPGLFADPSIVATPFGPGLNYPPATGGHARFGGGFHCGVFYDPDTNWKFGAAVKSPQWFDTYTYNSVTVDGRIARPKFNFDFPMVASVGAAYDGFERLLIATDLRFFDFRDTNGFRHSGFDRNGAITGLGWQNVFALATGVQYECTDFLTLRAGYTFAMNPAGNAVSMFNILAPTILQHSLSAGFSYSVSKSMIVSLAYVHMFENSIHGPIITSATGAIPGTDVRNAATADSVVLGASVAF